MTRKALIAAGLLLAGCTGVAVAQQADEAPAPAARPPGMPQPITLAQRPGATGGEALYIEKCAMCHGPNGMGTGLLGRRRDVALLEARGDLPAAYVVIAARQGVGNMPAIPRGEVSDADLQAIADYLAAGPHEVAQ
ncbi:MAG: cytochrome c [Erythrobacter sp.]|nr:cytochrome c [Erythrobacter sp.]